MDLSRLRKIDDYTWQVDPHGAMRVPAIFYADATLLEQMDQKVYEQACNVAMLPGIIGASYAMSDAHWGYGFPIGGVAAFDADRGGVISAGGVGFDISCGVRTLLTGLADARVRVRGELVWFWPQAKQSQAAPLVLRLVRLQQANHPAMCLASSVLDERRLTDRQIGQFYRMRWGQEVFHRSFKRTLAQHTLRSASPGQARHELDWAVMAYLVLGLWTVQAQIEARHDPLNWSVAQALRLVRTRLLVTQPVGRRPLLDQLRGAVKDRYVRHGPKAARHWPRKKNDHPPGLPKLREATLKERCRAITIYETNKPT